jgi:GntR family transcriptional regulator/MocR family aminotransferase
MGLRFAASRSYMASEDGARGLRVGFASLNDAEADAAVAGLRVALDAGQA